MSHPRKGESNEEYRIRDRAYQRARRADPITGLKVREWQRTYNIAHRAEINTRQRAANIRREDRFRQYGLTREMFDEYLDAQEGACAFCGTQLPKDITKFAIDHDHTTGVYRGLVHNSCNVAIGKAEKHFIGYMAASG